MNYLLGTDIGTSGTKTILTDLNGNVLAQDLQETDILPPPPPVGGAMAGCMAGCG